MLYCKNCKKEVFVFGIPVGVPGAEEAVEEQRKEAKKKGYLILFNPPPQKVAPYVCPQCFKKLAEK